MTAQLRHCAAPQPNLVPVMPRYSRRKSFIESSSRTSIGPCAWPLIVRLNRRHASTPLSMACRHRQGLEAMAGGVEDGVEQRRHDRDHHDLRHALRRLVRRQRRQHLDLEVAQRQVGSAGDEILPEIPLRRCRARPRRAAASPAARSRRPSRSRPAPGPSPPRAPAPCRIRTRYRPWRCAARRSRARSRRGPACRTSRCRLVPIRLLSVGGNLTLTRLMRSNLPLPLRTASASISARYCSPDNGKRARDHAQREKLCATAPVTKLRACARRGERRQRQRREAGHDELPVLPAAPSPIPWRADRFGAMRHSSSAAGHRPKRKMTRAASAAEWVPTCAPIEAAGRRADRGHPARISLRGVLRLLVHRVGIARRDQPEHIIAVDARRPTPRRRRRRDGSRPGWPARCRCRCPSRHGSQ